MKKSNLSMLALTACLGFSLNACVHSSDSNTEKDIPGMTLSSKDGLRCTSVLYRSGAVDEKKTLQLFPDNHPTPMSEINQKDTAIHAMKVSDFVQLCKNRGFFKDAWNSQTEKARVKQEKTKAEKETEK